MLFLVAEAGGGGGGETWATRYYLGLIPGIKCKKKKKSALQTILSLFKTNTIVLLFA